MTGQQQLAARMDRLATRALACARAGDLAGEAAARAMVTAQDRALFAEAMWNARVADAVRRNREAARLEAARQLEAIADAARADAEAATAIEYAVALASYQRSAAEWRAEHAATVARQTADLERAVMPDLAELIHVIAQYVQAAEGLSDLRRHTGPATAPGQLAA